MATQINKEMSRKQLNKFLTSNGYKEIAFSETTNCWIAKKQDNSKANFFPLHPLVSNEEIFQHIYNTIQIKIKYEH